MIMEWKYSILMQTVGAVGIPAGVNIVFSSADGSIVSADGNYIIIATGGEND